MPIPIYQQPGTQYEADTCLPVMQAAEKGHLRHVSLARGHYPGRRLPRGLLPGLKVAGFWDAAHDQDWGLEWHRNEGIEVTFLESGTLGFAVDRSRFELKPNDITFTRPWQLHRVGNPNVATGRLHFLILDVGVRRPHQTWRWPPWLVLMPNDLKQLTDILRHNEQPVWHATADITRCFRQIASAVETDHEGSSLTQLAVYANHLFMAILDMFRQQSVALDASLSSAYRTVELFWADLRDNRECLATEWTIAGMARRCGLGATRFIHYSRQLTNMTPFQYLNHCRLALACKLLNADPQQSVTQIALDCGFASSQYFATLFRRSFGVTPREFRAEQYKIGCSCSDMPPLSVARSTFTPS